MSCTDMYMIAVVTVFLPTVCAHTEYCRCCYSFVERSTACLLYYLIMAFDSAHCKVDKQHACVASAVGAVAAFNYTLLLLP
jgi:hypothetical protein